MDAKLTVLSLGWGLQSWTLAAMSALGELPKLDYAIHSDTTWERSETYKFAEKWTPWLEGRGVKVVTVSEAQAASEVANSESKNAFIPAYRDHSSPTIGDSVEMPVYITDGRTDGQLRRQCTGRWKIDPIRRFLSGVLSDRRLTKKPGIITQWLGITLDEWRRARDSGVKYIKHEFPLLDLRMDRAACLAWLSSHDLPAPVKSACVICPYQSAARWEELKREGGADWKIALEVDKAIRDKRPPFPVYLHRDTKPLEDAVVIPEDYGLTQANMLDGLDDSGCDSVHCFL